MITIIKKIPLNGIENCQYTSIDFWKQNYYATLPSICKIDKLDCRLMRKHRFDTNLAYHSITHSDECNLFYLSSMEVKNKLFLADDKMKILKIINLTVPANVLAPISSISFDDCEKRILITTKNNIYSVTKDGYYIKGEINLSEFDSNKIIPQPMIPGNNCCQPRRNIPINNPIIFTCSAYFCCQKFVAYTKNNSSYIAELSDNGNIIENSYIGDNITINSMFNKKGSLELLITTNSLYNYIYKTDLCCQKNNNCNNGWDDCFLDCYEKCMECCCDDCCEKCQNCCCNECCEDCNKCCCNECCEECNKCCCDECCEECNKCCCDECCEECQKCCYDECCEECNKCCYDECCEECNKCCKKKCDCQENICNIIESIAHIELGLSHILNAEGEKIQKILEISNNSEEIMKVNSSVNSTIFNITTLEQILLGKLNSAKECLEKLDCINKCNEKKCK